MTDEAMDDDSIILVRHQILVGDEANRDHTHIYEDPNVFEEIFENLDGSITKKVHVISVCEVCGHETIIETIKGTIPADLLS